MLPARHIAMLQSGVPVRTALVLEKRALHTRCIPLASPISDLPSHRSGSTCCPCTSVDTMSRSLLCSSRICSKTALSQCASATRPVARLGISTPSCRSCFHSCQQHSHQSTSHALSRLQATHRLGEQLRLVMRASAQPVTIITAFLPPPPPSSQSPTISSPSAFLAPKRTYPTHAPPPTTPTDRTLVHGATLSSFSSVSLDPPRVAFSLRVPSRLADALLHDALVASQSSAPSVPNFVINLLSSSQADVART